MFSWLYRYIFRGLGILLVIGMITVLMLAVASKRGRTPGPAVPAHSARP